MKTKFIFFTLSFLVMGSCGPISTSSSISNLLPSALIDEAIHQPNQIMMRALETMMTSSDQASKLTVNAEGRIIQSTQESNGYYAFTSNQLVDFDMESILQTNDLKGENPQAKLDVFVHSFILNAAMGSGPQTSIATVQLNNQTITAYYDQGWAYLNLTGAQNLLALAENPLLSVPKKVKMFIGHSDVLGFTQDPVMIAQFMDDLLPLLQRMPLVRTTVEGTNLVMRYELNASNFSQVIEEMMHIESENQSMTSEEIDILIHTLISSIDLTTFTLVIQVNLLTQMIQELTLDLDVKFISTEMIKETYYDPEHPDANADGIVEGSNMTIRHLSDFDVFLSLNLETFQDSRPIVLPVDKDSYFLLETISLI